MSNNQHKGLHRGWWIIITTFLIMVFCYAPVVSLFGLFYGPMSEGLHVSRSAIAMIPSVLLIGQIPGCLMAGKILTRHKIRYTISIMLLISAAGYLVTALSNNMMVIYVATVFRGFCAPFVPSMALAVLSDRWFGPKSRGKAVGLATAGSGIGGVFLSPVTATIIEKFTWKGGILFFALMCALMAPLVLLTWYDDPAELGLSRIGEVSIDDAESKKSSDVYGPTYKEALRSPVFLFTFLAFTLGCVTSTTLLSLGPSFLEFGGMQAVTASTVISFATLGIFIGKLVLGVLSDKFGVAPCMVVCGLMMAASYLIMLPFMHNAVYAVCAGAAFISGLGGAIINIAMPLFTSSMFGNRSYSSIIGLIQMATSFGSSLGPTILTFTYEWTGDYRAAWLTAVVCALIFVCLTIVCANIRKRNPLQS